MGAPLTPKTENYLNIVILRVATVTRTEIVDNVLDDILWVDGVFHWNWKGVFEKLKNIEKKPEICLSESFEWGEL